MADTSSDNLEGVFAANTYGLVNSTEVMQTAYLEQRHTALRRCVEATGRMFEDGAISESVTEPEPDGVARWDSTWVAGSDRFRAKTTLATVRLSHLGESSLPYADVLAKAVSTAVDRVLAYVDAAQLHPATGELSVVTVHDNDSQVVAVEARWVRLD